MRENRDRLKLILFLMTLGSSMYGIFTPIYYLEQGVVYTRIISFLLFWCFGGMLAGVFSNLIINKLGIKSLIVIRGIVEPILIILINMYPYLKYPPEVQGIFSGFIVMSFWISIDALTARSTELGSRGKQQSNIYSGMQIAGIVAPFIGGFIINRLGYPLLFLFSLVLILVGGILSFGVKLAISASKKINLKPDFKGPLGVHMVLVFLRGMTFSMAAWLFPLIIYNLTRSEIILGSFGTVISIIAFLGNIVSGLLIDKFHKKAILFFYFGSTVSWLVTSLISGEAIFIFIAIISFFYTLINISLNVLFFNAIEKEKDIVPLVSERIISFCLGGMILIAMHFFFSYSVLFIICSGAVALSIPFLRKA
jgi:MFS family permease